MASVAVTAGTVQQCSGASDGLPSRSVLCGWETRLRQRQVAEHWIRDSDETVAFIDACSDVAAIAHGAQHVAGRIAARNDEDADQAPPAAINKHGRRLLIEEIEPRGFNTPCRPLQATFRS